jgi:hypothetical protein
MASQLFKTNIILPACGQGPILYILLRQHFIWQTGYLDRASGAWFKVPLTHSVVKLYGITRVFSLCRRGFSISLRQWVLRMEISGWWSVKTISNSIVATRCQKETLTPPEHSRATVTKWSPAPVGWHRCIIVSIYWHQSRKGRVETAMTFMQTSSWIVDQTNSCT